MSHPKKETEKVSDFMKTNQEKGVGVDHINRLQLELSNLATGQYYEFQEVRKKTMSHIRNIVFRKSTGLDMRELQKKKHKTKDEKVYEKEYADRNLARHIKNLERDGVFTSAESGYITQMLMLSEDLQEKEHQYKKLVEDLVRKEQIYWAMAHHKDTDKSLIHGLGPISVAMLLYYFGYCEYATHVSSLWKFAGLFPGAKFVAGAACSFNPRCRVSMWRIGDSLIKHSSPRYKPIYDTEKKRQIELMENGAESAPSRLGHADSRARRKMIKHFLADYYRVCKTLTNQPQTKPYVVDRLGHRHFDDVLVWLTARKQALMI